MSLSLTPKAVMLWERVNPKLKQIKGDAHFSGTQVPTLPEGVHRRKRVGATCTVRVTCIVS